MFRDYLKWLQIKQSARGSNRGLSSCFYWLRCANHVKSTEESVMCIEKYVYIKKKLTNGLNMGLSLRSWGKKTVYGVETHGLFDKEKIRMQPSVKKMILTVFWDIIAFLVIDSTVNNTFSYHLFHLIYWMTLVYTLSTKVLDHH